MKQQYILDGDTIEKVTDDMHKYFGELSDKYDTMTWSEFMIAIEIAKKFP